jgi:hypothetical protein
MIYFFNHFYLSIYLLFQFIIFYLFINLKKVQRVSPTNFEIKYLSKFKGYPLQILIQIDSHGFAVIGAEQSEALYESWDHVWFDDLTESRKLKIEK